MQLTAVLYRVNEQIYAQRKNRDDRELVLGVIHDETDQMLSIVVHPNGELTMTYGQLGAPDLETYVLGCISPDGTCELHEPELLV